MITIELVRLFQRISRLIRHRSFHPNFIFNVKECMRCPFLTLISIVRYESAMNEASEHLHVTRDLRYLVFITGLLYYFSRFYRLPI